MTKSRTLRKAGAVTLSLAMAASLAFVAPDTASAAVKKPKLSASKATLAGGKTKTVTIKNTKFKKTVKKFTVKTSNKSVATVKKVTVKKGKALKFKVTAKKIKAKKTATITATVTLNKKIKVGKKYKNKFALKFKATVKKTTPTPTPVQEDGITASLANPISAEYSDAVLVNTNAIIKVKATQDGKPLANQTIVFAATQTAPSNGTNDYEIKGQNTAVTDASGVAMFTIANQKTVKSSNENAVNTVKYTATLASTTATATAAKGYVRFASIDIAQVKNDNLDTNKKRTLVPGDNAKAAGITADAGAIGYEAPMSNPGANAAASNEYVVSQQVSATGTTTHEVVFKGGYPEINLPAGGADDTDAEKKVETVGFTTEKYHTYANKDSYNDGKEGPGNAPVAAKKPSDYKLVQLNYDIDNLTYATVAFTNVKLSKYSRLVVETWKDATKAEGTTYDPTYCVNRKVYGSDKGSFTDSSFGYEIKKEDNKAAGKWAVKAYIVSAGQVDTATNDGYTMKDITYVFDTKSTQAAGKKPLTGAKVEWSVVDTLFTAETELTSAVNGANTEYKLGANVLVSVPTAGNNIKRMTYKVPVFPFTGPAVLTGYDDTKAIKHYAIAIKNNGDNTNTIDTNAKAYLIADDELRDKQGTITSQDGTVLKVNSEQSGRMTLEGKIILASPIEGFDATKNMTYTSVLWNPVPTAAATTVGSAFVALKGQSIEVEAQLVDGNGNQKTDKDQSVAFTWSTSNTEIKEADTDVDGASITKKVFKTDDKGKAYLTLHSGAIKTINNLKAKATGNYKVNLIVKGTTVSAADLYWIDADLAYKENPAAVEVKTGSTSADQTKEILAGIEPGSGETWEYGVYAVASFDNSKGALSGKTLNLDGLTIKTDIVDGTATKKDVKNGTVELSTTKAGKVLLASKLAPTASDNIVIKEATETVAVVYAGTGATSIDKTIKLQPDFKVGTMKGEWADIVNTKAAATTRKLYYIVKDANNNPIENAEVTVKASNGKVNAEIGTTGDKVNTNKDGVAEFTITRAVASSSTAVTATVKGIDGVGDTKNINWVKADANAFKVNKASYSKTDNTITLEMTETVEPKSLHKGQWKVEYNGADATGLIWNPSEVKADGKKIILTVPSKSTTDNNGTFEVTYKHKEVKDKAASGIMYIAMSTEGVELTDNKSVTFKDDNDFTITANTTASAEVTVFSTATATGKIDNTNAATAGIDQVADLAKIAAGYTSTVTTEEVGGVTTITTKFAQDGANTVPKVAAGGLASTGLTTLEGNFVTFKFDIPKEYDGGTITKESVGTGLTGDYKDYPLADAKTAGWVTGLATGTDGEAWMLVKVGDGTSATNNAVTKITFTIKPAAAHSEEVPIKFVFDLSGIKNATA